MIKESERMSDTNTSASSRHTTHYQSQRIAMDTGTSRRHWTGTSRRCLGARDMLETLVSVFFTFFLIILILLSYRLVVRLTHFRCTQVQRGVQVQQTV